MGVPPFPRRSRQPCWEKAKWDSARTKGGTVFQGWGAKLPMRACAMYRCATNGGPTTLRKASQSKPSKGTAGRGRSAAPPCCRPQQQVHRAAQHDLALRWAQSSGHRKQGWLAG